MQCCVDLKQLVAPAIGIRAELGGRLEPLEHRLRAERGRRAGKKRQNETRGSEKMKDWESAKKLKNEEKRTTTSEHKNTRQPKQTNRRKTLNKMSDVYACACWNNLRTTARDRSFEAAIARARNRQKSAASRAASARRMATKRSPS